MVQETTGSEAIESSTKLPTEPTTSLIKKTDSTRDERAAELVDRLSLWSGAAGLIPVPLVDVAAVWGVPASYVAPPFRNLRSSIFRKPGQIDTYQLSGSDDPSNRCDHHD